MRRNSLVVFGTTFFLLGCGGAQQSTENSTQVVQEYHEDTNIKVGELDKDTPPIKLAEAAEAEPSQPSLSGPQMNALRSAQQYLSMEGFSRKGLIKQLSSDAGEGYSIADATVAVDSLGADWNQNAARSAKQYLEMEGFSCKGLVEQLSSSAGEEYTLSQAQYGANAAGAC